VCLRARRTGSESFFSIIEIDSMFSPLSVLGNPKKNHSQNRKRKAKSEVKTTIPFPINAVRI
jgi:hypothetical protein